MDSVNVVNLAVSPLAECLTNFFSDSTGVEACLVSEVAVLDWNVFERHRLFRLSSASRRTFAGFLDPCLHDEEDIFCSMKINIKILHLQCYSRET